MAAENLSLINAALTRTGNEPITSLVDGTAGARIASENYEEMVLGELAAYPWKFATKTQTLNLLTDTPDPPWLYGYQMPSDVKHLRTVMVAGYPVVYEIQSDKVLCNQDSTVAVIAKYTWRPDEEDWPKYFRVAIIAMLEPMFLRGIGERYSEADSRQKTAERVMARARLVDASSQTPRAVDISPTLQARWGSVPSSNALPNMTSWAAWWT